MRNSINIHKSLLILLVLSLFIFSSQPSSAAFITSGNSPWSQNGTSLYYNTGSVGIGTTAPQDKLEVSGIARFSRSSTSSQYIQLTTEGGVATIGSYGGVALALGVGGSTRMFIGNDGNTGIGTTNPLHKLTVVGGAQTYQPTIGLYSTAGSGNGLDRNWAILANYVTYGDFGITQSNADDGNPVSAGTTRFYIKNDGNVGVGTTNPTSKLSIVGTGTGYEPSLSASQDGNFNISRGPAGATNLVFSISGAIPYTASIQHRHAAVDGISYPISLNPLGGNVGIGTTDPDAKLAFASSTDNTIHIHGGRIRGLRNTVTDDDEAVSRKYLHDNFTSSSTTSSIQGSLWATSTDVTYNVGLGNVGIGTTNTNGYKLKVAGDVSITGILQTQSGSDFAEEFSVSSDLEPGTVVIMADMGHKSVKASVYANDKTVVGIVSDNPSIIAGRVDSEKKVIVAMMGVVSVKATNVNGQISKGDLLTSSNTTGHAMKSKSYVPGTVIGKALENLSTEQGIIKVLVNLQ